MSSVIPEDELVPQDPDLCLRKLTSLNVNKEKGLGSDFLQELAGGGGLAEKGFYNSWASWCAAKGFEEGACFC